MKINIRYIIIIVFIIGLVWLWRSSKISPHPHLNNVNDIVKAATQLNRQDSALLSDSSLKEIVAVEKDTFQSQQIMYSMMLSGGEELRCIRFPFQCDSPLLVSAKTGSVEQDVGVTFIHNSFGEAQFQVAEDSLTNINAVQILSPDTTTISYNTTSIFTASVVSDKVSVAFNHQDYKGIILSLGSFQKKRVDFAIFNLSDFSILAFMVHSKTRVDLYPHDIRKLFRN